MSEKPLRAHNSQKVKQILMAHGVDIQEADRCRLQLTSREKAALELGRAAVAKLNSHVEMQFHDPFWFRNWEGDGIAISQTTGEGDAGFLNEHPIYWPRKEFLNRVKIIAPNGFLCITWLNACLFSVPEFNRGEWEQIALRILSPVTSLRLPLSTEAAVAIAITETALRLINDEGQYWSVLSLTGRDREMNGLTLSYWTEGRPLARALSATTKRIAYATPGASNCCEANRLKICLGGREVFYAGWDQGEPLMVRLFERGDWEAKVLAQQESKP